MQSFFEPVIFDIIKFIEAQRTDRTRVCRRCQSSSVCANVVQVIVLSGGFSNNRYLHERLSTHFHPTTVARLSTSMVGT